MKVRAFNDAGELAKATALLISVRAARAILERNRATIALSGGPQMLPVLRALAEPPLCEVTPWARMDFFFCEERQLEPGDAWSSLGQARAELFDKGGLPAGNVHAMELDRFEPEEAAARYQADLRTYFWGRKPELDLAVLALGDEGQVAGLFAGHPLLLGGKEYASAVMPPPGVEPQAPLVTLSLPVLRAARNVVLLALGQERAQVAAQALAAMEGFPGPAYPASLLKAQDELYWFSDVAVEAKAA